MRFFSIILLLILVSCKSDTKNKTEIEPQTAKQAETEDASLIQVQGNENGIDKSVYEMWSGYLESHPEFKNEELPDADSFHNNEEDANRLADLILSGKKKAGSILYYFFEEANADLPKVGTKSIVTNFDGTARAIIEIKKVDTIPFNQISKAYAELDMGTNIQPLKKWKKAHWDFFAPAMQENGGKPTEEMLIVCTWFETIWPEKG